MQNTRIVLNRSSLVLLTLMLLTATGCKYLGPKTVAAIRAWQVARGEVPDGFPTPAMVLAVKP